MNRHKRRWWSEELASYVDNIAQSGDAHLYEFHLHFTGHHQLYDCEQELVVEQCTGLKDKNGTLIYEGDVLIGSYRWGTETYVCRWADNCGGFVFDIGVDDSLIAGEDFDINICRVMGNFHQHPHLLKGETQ